MATGFLANGTCFEDLNLARDAYYSSQPVVSHFDPVLNVTFADSFQFLNGVWTRVTTASVPGWTNNYSSFTAIDPPFPVCLAPSECFNMGVEIGWALCSAMTVIVFVSFIRKVLHV